MSRIRLPRFPSFAILCSKSPKNAPKTFQSVRGGAIGWYFRGSPLKSGDIVTHLAFDLFLREEMCRLMSWLLNFHDNKDFVMI